MICLQERCIYNSTICALAEIAKFFSQRKSIIIFNLYAIYIAFRIYAIIAKFVCCIFIIKIKEK